MEMLENGKGPVSPNKTDTAILVLNTKPFAAKPMIFDLNGECWMENFGKYRNF